MSRNLLLLALSGLLLSGCITDPPSDGPPDVAVVESPTDYGYLNDGAGAHLHDYWGGTDEIRVIEAEDAASPVTDGVGSIHEYYVFRPEPDVVVPQGTAELRVTVRFQDDLEGGHKTPVLFMKNAAQRNWTEVGPVPDGDTIVIPTTNGMNDVPHQRISAWEFGIRLPPVDGSLVTLTYSEASMEAVAVRGIEIPLFPAHPDPWQGDDMVVVFDWQSPYVDTPVAGTTLTNRQPADPVPGAVVPFDAAYVEVVFTVYEETQVGSVAVPSGGGMGLSFHGADSHEWTRLDHGEEEGAQRVYRIDPAGIADGPYAESTLWAFAAVGDLEDIGAKQYSIQVTAYRDEPAFL